MVSAKAKKSAESINSRLQLVVKSGKYSLGYKSTLKSLRQNKAKLVLIADNIPYLRRTEIEYYAMLARIGIHHYDGSNNDLERLAVNTSKPLVLPFLILVTQIL